MHEVIEALVVPATTRIYERRRQAFGLSELRPWDMTYDPLARQPQRPFETPAQLEAGVARLCEHLHPQFARHFATLHADRLLDLSPRPSKSTLGGGYSVPLRRTKRSFIFMNAGGYPIDVQTLLHEAGHSFHNFETHALPYFQQREPGVEFRELVAITMQFIAAPFLTREQGGFYSEADVASVHAQEFERSLLSLPQLTMVDAFQHWAYENPDESVNPDACDAAWSALFKRFYPAINGDGVEAGIALGWQQALLIYTQPFYSIEYVLAQTGALQVLQNVQKHGAAAIEQYRQAMALGNTVPLTALYQAVGASLVFDAETLGETVTFLQNALESPPAS